MTVSITQIVKCECLSEEIISNTSHLNCILSVEFSSVDKVRSHKGHWIVSLSHDEHSHDSLIAIDNEIASKLSHVFMLLNEFLLG